MSGRPRSPRSPVQDLGMAMNEFKNSTLMTKEEEKASWLIAPERQDVRGAGLDEFQLLSHHSKE